MSFNVLLLFSLRIPKHIADNDIIDKFQSVYRCGHSMETILLHMYNDIVTIVIKGNMSYLDLSMAFDTPDLDDLVVMIENMLDW